VTLKASLKRQIYFMSLRKPTTTK